MLIFVMSPPKKTMFSTHFRGEGLQWGGWVGLPPPPPSLGCRVFRGAEKLFLVQS